jgi:LacI family transcriptional regulator
MNTLGVTVLFNSSELNLYFLEVFNGIIEAANARNQNTTVFTIPDWSDFERIRACCDGRIDGMILVGPLLPVDLPIHLPVGIPFVSVHSNHKIPGIPDISCEEEAGAHAMVTALLEAGHRRILHLAGPLEYTGALKRRAGFFRAMRDWSVEPENILEAPGSYSNSQTHLIFGDWLDKHRGQAMPDAIFCANDASAIACLEVLQGRGYRVPEDVSLCGFDDSLVARISHLASVRQPLREMGNESVAILMERIEAQLGNKISEPEIDEPTIVFPTRCSIRNSMGQARADAVMIR